MAGSTTLRRVAGEVRRDVRAAQERDPAAAGVSASGVLAAWPGVHALLAHRVAHALQSARVPLLPRAIAYLTRSVTGIEIHPAARIGDGLFIDHGMGVVIGETAEVGDDVLIYHGVTLGGLSFDAKGKPGKRHPTVCDGAAIGAGAQVLGPITVGAGARIGANAVVVAEVPPGASVVGIPARPPGEHRVMPAPPPCGESPGYGLGDRPCDPVGEELAVLRAEVASLRAEMAELRRQKLGMPAAE